METILWLESYLTRAERMIADGRVEEGLAILCDLLYDEPGYARLHNHLGWAYMYYTQDVEKAEQHFKLAIRFAPEYAPPYLHMGNLLNRAGRYTEAVECFREGLEKPQALRAVLLEGMAHAYEVSGKLRLAMRAYREAATYTVVDYEVERMLNAVKRCRRKKLVTLFSLW